MCLCILYSLCRYCALGCCVVHKLWQIFRATVVVRFIRSVLLRLLGWKIGKHVFIANYLQRAVRMNKKTSAPHYCICGMWKVKNVYNADVGVSSSVLFRFDSWLRLQSLCVTRFILHIMHQHYLMSLWNIKQIWVTCLWKCRWTAYTAFCALPLLEWQVVCE